MSDGVSDLQSSIINFRFPRPSSLAPRPSAFTLTELLIVMAVIGMLAAMSLGALQAVREMGREAATKATIAKLHAIIMRRYDSYMYRRIPVNLSGLSPEKAAQDRLYAIRDLMRMEMPDRSQDLWGPDSAPISNVTQLPIELPNSKTRMPPPALVQLYRNYYTAHYHDPGASMANKLAGPAAMLYMIVSLGSPEDMEQFTQSEIGDTDNDGMLEFLDGWGRPIFFLRWAPGYSAYSDIQVADPVNHHDPFDPRRTDSAAYKLIPLIYSGGPNSDAGLERKAGFSFNTTGGNIFGDSNFAGIGAPSGTLGKGDITNHHIEAR